MLCAQHTANNSMWPFSRPSQSHTKFPWIYTRVITANPLHILTRMFRADIMTQGAVNRITYRRRESTPPPNPTAPSPHGHIVRIQAERLLWKFWKSMEKSKTFSYWQFWALSPIFLEFGKNIEAKGFCWPVPVAARSEAWVFGRSLAGNVGSNPAGAWMSACCVLSGRGLCDGLITHPEESYRV